MKLLSQNKNIIQIISEIQNQEFEELLVIENFDNVFITSEKYPNILIKPYFNDLKEESLKLIGNQKHNVDLVDCYFTDYFVSTISKDSETDENVFNAISLTEFICLQSLSNKNFIFEQVWNLYIPKDLI